jgi:hypothetical protein
MTDRDIQVVQAGQRAVHALIQAEIDHRLRVEGELKKAMGLIQSLAYKMDGLRLETLRKADPMVLDRWLLADWDAFFKPLVIESKQAWDPDGWGQGVGRTIEVKTPVDAQVEDLKKQLTEKDEEVEVLQGKLEAEQTKKEDLAAQVEVLKRQKASGLAVLEREPAGVAEGLLAVPQSGQTVYERQWMAASSFELPVVPVKYRYLFPSTKISQKYNAEKRYRRELLVLKFQADTGIVSRVELQYMFSMLEGISYSGGSASRVIKDMVESKLLSKELLHLSAGMGITSTLMLAPMTRTARQICESWGWEVCEDEMTRCVRLHQGRRQKNHMAALLFSAMHARLRGFEVEMLPEVSRPAAPDLKLKRGGQVWYVEVELGNPKDNKWRNLAALKGGQPAVIAGGPEQEREFLTRWASLRLGEIYSTNIFNLIFGPPEFQKAFPDKKLKLEEIRPQDSLWMHRP